MLEDCTSLVRRPLMLMNFFESSFRSTLHFQEIDTNDTHSKNISRPHAAGFDESLLTFEMSEEQDHLNRCDDDVEYDAHVKKFYKLLKYITAKGAAKSNFRIMI